MFKVEEISKNKLVIGLLLIMIGILIPNFLSVYSFNIIDNLNSAVTEGKVINLFKAAIYLVLLNSLRAYPHYIGAFYLSDAFKFSEDNLISRYSKLLINMIVIPVVYFMILHFSNVRYHFGVPAIMLIVLVSHLGRRDYRYVSEWKKIFMIIFFITSIQFLDVVPLISFMPFGRGETSQEVKLTSMFLDVQDELSVFALSLFVVFIIFSILLYMLINDENNLLAMNDLRKENLILANETRLKNLENRTFQETRYLVHDLKSPLTSAQALVGLVRQSCADKDMAKEYDYLGRVENSIDRISIMISEILSERARFNIKTDDIVNSLLSNISTTSYSSIIEVYNNVPGASIFVNKVYFIRALANLIENSYQAIKGNNGKIEIMVNREVLAGNNFITFTVKDNGSGIESENLKYIWETGYSTKNSYGLGLGFVTKVIERSKGEIYIESLVNVGTKVIIMLKEE